MSVFERGEVQWSVLVVGEQRQPSHVASLALITSSDSRMKRGENSTGKERGEVRVVRRGSLE